MYLEYDVATLKKLQDCELNILKDFIAICDKYDIEYFAIGGTAIGAERHHGFIPWDDDIDIGMLRKDYDRFVEVAEKEMGDKYEVMNAAKSEEFPVMTTRFQQRGTKFIYYPFRKLKCNLGIFVDIFVYETVADLPKEQDRQIRKAWFWYKLMILQKIPDPILPFGGWKKIAVHFVCHIIHYMLRIFRIKREFLYKKCMETALEHEGEKTEWICNLSDTKPHTDIFKRADVFPTKKEPFEDIYIRVPRNNEKILKLHFGDYMTLPPADKRKNHPPTILKFADGEEIVFGGGRKNV